MKPALSELVRIHLQGGDYAAATIDSKQRAFNFFVSLFGDLRIDEVTFGHAEDFQNNLRRGGRNAKTVNLYTIHLHHFFDWAVKRRYAEGNPFFGLRLVKTEDKKLPVFTDAEVCRAFTVADLRWRVLLILGLCGLRKSEALNLCRDDLNFEDGFILIRPKSDTPATWPWRIKNRKSAYAPMPDVIVLPDMVIPAHKTIQTLLLDVPSEQPYICVKPAYYRMLIEQKNGKMLHFSKMLCPWGNFDRDFKGLLKRGGVKRKSFHDLRRTFAGKLLDNGYGLKEVQTLMRHSSIQTTARFYQNVEERALINKVNGTFKHYVSNVL